MLKNRKAFIALFVAAAMLFSLVAASSAATSTTTATTTAKTLTVYYVKKAEGKVFLVREVHPTNHKILDWFALDEVLHGDAYTPGVLDIFNSNSYVQSTYKVGNRMTINFSGPIFKSGVAWDVRQAAIQALVNTVTEFDKDMEVRFTVNGGSYWGNVKRDLTNVREGSPVQNPGGILITSPRAGQWIWSPLTVTGYSWGTQGFAWIQLRDNNSRLLDEGWARIQSNGKFSAKLYFNPNTTRGGNLQVRIFDVDTWKMSPVKTVKVNF